MATLEEATLTDVLNYIVAAQRLHIKVVATIYGIDTDSYFYLKMSANGDEGTVRISPYSQQYKRTGQVIQAKQLLNGAGWELLEHYGTVAQHLSYPDSIKRPFSLV
jgi:hypothetical protein